MKTKQAQMKVRLSEDLLKRMLYISQAEGRTPNNQILLLLRNNIQYYEKTHGKIPSNALQAIDISAYLPEENSVDEEDGSLE